MKYDGQGNIASGKIIQPKVTTDEVNAKLFRDVLASSSTSFPHPVKTITTEA